VSLSDNYGIYLKPTANIKELILHLENEIASIKGQLGFCNIRGRNKDSYEEQLALQVKSKICYNSKYTYEELLQEYTHVVLATGDASYAKKVQNYREDLELQNILLVLVNIQVIY